MVIHKQNSFKNIYVIFIIMIISFFSIIMLVNIVSSQKNKEANMTEKNEILFILQKLEEGEYIFQENKKDGGFYFLNPKLINEKINLELNKTKLELEKNKTTMKEKKEVLDFLIKEYKNHYLSFLFNKEMNIDRNNQIKDIIKDKLKDNYLEKKEYEIIQKIIKGYLIQLERDKNDYNNKLEKGKI